MAPKKGEKKAADKAEKAAESTSFPYANGTPLIGP